MSTDRRDFVRAAALGVCTSVMAAPVAAAGASESKNGSPDLSRYMRNPGPKETVRGLKAACSTQSAIATETVVKTLRAGGNAVDAAIAGAMVQAAVEPYQSNHTGTVSFLCYEARTGKFHQLDSTGTFPGGIAPFRPGRNGGESTGGRVSVGPASACIPGFMPGLKAMYERFGSRPWASLCEDAIRWAEEGHPVTSVEYGGYTEELESLSYFPESRRFFLPDGYLRPVGSRFASKAMAQTLRAVAAEGPDHMISGAWADEFVATANAMGWKIQKAHMTETPPRWLEPLRLRHHEYEIIGLAPPQQQGIFCALVLGILRHLGIREVAPQSARTPLLHGSCIALEPLSLRVSRRSRRRQLWVRAAARRCPACIRRRPDPRSAPQDRSHSTHRAHALAFRQQRAADGRGGAADDEALDLRAQHRR